MAFHLKGDGSNTLSGGFNNSGNITITSVADASSSAASASTLGVNLNQIGLSGDFVNSGTISAAASATAYSSAEADAHGVILGGGSTSRSAPTAGLFLNSGSVIVSASATGTTATASADATGIQIYSQNFSGSIVNSGSISTTVSAFFFFR